MNLCNRCFIVVLFGLLLLNMTSCVKEKDVKPIKYRGSYARDFNDMNDLHLKAAKTIGVAPASSRDEIERIKKELREIKTSKTYVVDELTHSIPYLVPKAADLLSKIGNNFSDSLQRLNAPHYKLVVTSVLRTKLDVKNLRKRNGNSSENSAHVYATTFDISWVSYAKNDDSRTELTSDQLKMVLASVLRDLKKENLCYVKHERKQGCFHITAR